MDFDRNTLSKLNIQKVRKCPLCGSARRKKFEIDEHKVLFKAVKCQECSLIYMDSVVDPADMPKLYAGYNDQRNQQDKSLQEKRKVQYNLDIAYLGNHLAANEAILDIGGGRGDFISRLPATNSKNIVEVDGSAVAAGKELYKDITFYSSLDAVPAKVKFDAVIFRGTLQYMADLNDTAKKCRALLKNGGKIILLAIPNADSLLAQLQREYWALFNRVEHRYCFGTSQVSKMFGTTFTITNVEFPYMGTPYENYPADLEKLINIYQGKKGAIKARFPFFGSMMNVVLTSKR